MHYVLPIHKYTWTSPTGIKHNQIDHVLVDKRRQSSIIDVRSLRGADCDTDHYLVVATIRERLSLKKGIKLHLVADRYKLKTLLHHETRKEYQIDTADRFSTMEGLVTSSVDDTLVKIRDSIKDYTKMRVVVFLETHRHKPWFDQECSE